jgi:hypothetical protein
MPPEDVGAGFAGPPVSYSEIEPELRTGYLMLLHGGERESREIEFVTNSPYSHVGMIVRPDPSKPALIWQTGPRPIVPDPQTGTRHGGAQLGLLGEMIEYVSDPARFEGVFIRRLKMRRSPTFETAVLRTIAAYDGTPFPTMVEMVEDWVAGRLHIPTTPKRAFCAELVAETFQMAGLLGNDPPANGYSPGDFGDEPARVRLRGGATLLDVVPIAPVTVPAPRS